MDCSPSACVQTLVYNNLYWFVCMYVHVCILAKLAITLAMYIRMYFIELNNLIQITKSCE